MLNRLMSAVEMWPKNLVVRYCVSYDDILRDYYEH